jgi:predicted nucleic acid-binding protein
MMRVLFDTNVVLDVLLQREPWVSEASGLWQANDEGRITGYMIASAVADVFYIARRLVGLEMAQQAVQTCLDAFEICPVDRWDLERARLLPGMILRIISRLPALGLRTSMRLSHATPIISKRLRCPC